MATLKRQKNKNIDSKEEDFFADFLLETSICARRWNKAYTQSLEEVIVAQDRESSWFKAISV